MTWILLAAVALTACGGGDDGDSGGGTPGGGGGGGNPLPVKTKMRNLTFPGADGGARQITGGAERADGDVYIVTTLEDGALGSLRMGLNSGNRTIVFAVGGEIKLKSALNISKNNITIAGQTAPGDGITISGWPVFISGSNVVLRFLRFRMGAQNIDAAGFSADDGDALGGKDDQNIMIDHCSISYSTDECASFSRITNFTMQYCIISESLKLAGHSKGNHGYGGIWGGRNAAYHHNLVAHHDSRNPRFDHSYVGRSWRGPIDFVNNVVYDWGSNSTYGGETDSESNVFHVNMMGNYYKAGPSTKSNVRNRVMELTSYCINCIASGFAATGKFYLQDNLINGNAAAWDNVDSEHSSKETRDKATLKENAKLAERWTTGLTELKTIESAQNAYNNVLTYAGASLVRDAVDKRIVQEVKDGTGGIIDKATNKDDDPEREKYFPTLAPGTPITDTDKDGMDDNWERKEIAKLGASVGIEELKPLSYNISNRYTNLEVYMNELVVNTFPDAANANSTR